MWFSNTLSETDVKGLISVPDVLEKDNGST
jgi:hypothetical protein